MEIITTRDELREVHESWRHDGEHIALVPTMGNLHTGHLSLVELASQHAERVVVSVFVNPTQFGDGEDFDEYPRTLKRDTQRLKKLEADVLFTPDVATVYPFGIDKATVVSVPGLTRNFCGASRPGHFDGVTSVVARLFALVQPDVAVFGQKDYQQQLVIRHMTADLSLPACRWKRSLMLRLASCQIDWVPHGGASCEDILDLIRVRFKGRGTI